MKTLAQYTAEYIAKNNIRVKRKGCSDKGKPRKKRGVPQPKHPITSIGSSFMPDTRTVWAEFITTGGYSGSGSSATIGNNIRLNSITTCDGTNPIQRIGEFNTIYKMYEVIGAKVSIYITNQSAGGSPIVANLFAGASADAPSSVAQCFTFENSRNKIIPVFASSGSASASEIKGYWVTSKYIDLNTMRGRKSDPSTDAGSCAYGAYVEPENLLYLCPKAFTLLGGTGASILNGLYLIKVSYRVKLYNNISA